MQLITIKTEKGTSDDAPFFCYIKKFSS